MFAGYLPFGAPAGGDPAHPSGRMAEREPSTTPVVPAVAGLVAAGMMTVGFGAGYGARAWNNSEAKRELLEKFPEQATP